jgi:hypothetical protein
MGCKAPALSGKARLQLKDKTPDKKDVLNWLWNKGDATLASEHGTPLSTTGYVLCLYDQSANPQPLLRAHAPAGGLCAGKACWKASKNGFKYRDKLLDPDGLAQILLRSGSATKAKILVKGKGDNLPMPALPLTPKVTVQLKNDEGFCWQAEYSTPSKNQADQFKAKAD